MRPMIALMLFAVLEARTELKWILPALASLLLAASESKTYRERGELSCFGICGSENKTRNKLVSFAGLRSGTAFQSCQMPFSVQERQSERAKCRSHNENGIELKCKCGSQTKNGISFFIVCGS